MLIAQISHTGCSLRCRTLGSPLRTCCHILWRWLASPLRHVVAARVPNRNVSRAQQGSIFVQLEFDIKSNVCFFVVGRYSEDLEPRASTEPPYTPYTQLHIQHAMESAYRWHDQRGLLRQPHADVGLEDSRQRKQSSCPTDASPCATNRCRYEQATAYLPTRRSSDA